MSDLTDLPQEKKDETGAHVASLKAELHDVENKISENKLAEIDWHGLRDKLSKLVSLLDALLNPPFAAATSTKPHTSHAAHPKPHK